MQNNDVSVLHSPRNDTFALKSTAPPTVYLIEDDAEVRQSLQWMLSELDVSVEAFDKPSSVLALPPPSSVGCLVVDLRLPEMDGMALLQKLRGSGWKLPFIVITGFGSIPDAVSAMREGAVDFIQKPLFKAPFLDRVSQAIKKDESRRECEERKSHVLAMLDRLTPREGEVLDLVVTGRLNKQIAVDLGVSIKTVETHRSSVTRKLEVDSVAQLVRLVLEARS